MTIHALTPIIQREIEISLATITELMEIHRISLRSQEDPLARRLYETGLDALSKLLERPFSPLPCMETHTIYQK